MMYLTITELRGMVCIAMVSRVTGVPCSSFYLDLLFFLLMARGIIWIALTSSKLQSFQMQLDEHYRRSSSPENSQSSRLLLDSPCARIYLSATYLLATRCFHLTQKISLRRPCPYHGERGFGQRKLESPVTIMRRSLDPTLAPILDAQYFKASLSLVKTT